MWSPRLWLVFTLLLLSGVVALWYFVTQPQFPPPVVAGPVIEGSTPFRYVDVSGENLPAATLHSECLDVAFLDADSDGDLDIFVGNEHLPNLLLDNDGEGNFSDVSEQRLPRTAADSEDTAADDFDGDQTVDIFVATERGKTDEYYLNNGQGVFSDATQGTPVSAVSNAVAVGDLDGDGDSDLLLGNEGKNFVWLNDGAGQFSDHSSRALPEVKDYTQDLALGDLDGDGDLDLVVANEDHNRLLLGDGSGTFTEAAPGALPLIGTEETRDVDLADVDGDGDLDIFFGNVQLTRDGPAQNRLLLNNGDAVFSDETDKRLPRDKDNTKDGDFVDIDRDGDADLVTANYGVEDGGYQRTPYRVLINEQGHFSLQTEKFFPAGVIGHGFDLQAGDLNGDGIDDFYLCSGRSLDRLLLSEQIVDGSKVN